MKMIITTPNSGTIEWSIPDQLEKALARLEPSMRKMVERKAIDLLAGYVSLLSATTGYYLKTGEPALMNGLGETLIAFMKKEKLDNLKH